MGTTICGGACGDTFSKLRAPRLRSASVLFDHFLFTSFLGYPPDLGFICRQCAEDSLWCSVNILEVKHGSFFACCFGASLTDPVHRVHSQLYSTLVVMLSSSAGSDTPSGRSSGRRYSILYTQKCWLHQSQSRSFGFANGPLLASIAVCISVWPISRIGLHRTETSSRIAGAVRARANVGDVRTLTISACQWGRGAVRCTRRTDTCARGRNRAMS